MLIKANSSLENKKAASSVMTGAAEPFVFLAYQVRPFY
jgi:hypothetical protein